MSLEIVTKDELEVFRLRLLEDIRETIIVQQLNTVVKPEGHKTACVRRMPDCPVNKLVPLRVCKKLRPKKIGGTPYYNQADVKRLLDE